MKFGTVEQAIQDIRAGKFVIVADDEDRENEGDLICAAELITPDMVNFMLRAKGMICLALPPERIRALELPMQSEDTENTEAMLTVNAVRIASVFTVSIDAAGKFGVTTGISAADRATTIRVAADPRTTAAELRRPGHVHPLKARAGGVLQRVGHTEAAVDLCRLAGLQPAGVLCEILDEQGVLLRRDALHEFARAHELTFITVADLVAHRLQHERLVHRVAEATLPVEIPPSQWKIIGYRNDVDRAEHVALAYGEVGDGENILVRMHSKCLTGDVFHSRRCDCGWQLMTAMEMIVREGRGVVVYLDQEGRGIGLLNKLKAYALQDAGHDTVEANEALGFAPDLRSYGIGTQILLDIGVKSVRLLTNNPKKLVGLKGYGLEVVDRVRIEAPATDANSGYLLAKRLKLGHMLAS
jgi:3,4-dihydroxy 2-butanone 4-phosphate synthase / GTP cyclohydrolase II